MAIQIGTVYSVGHADDTEFVPDDRQQLIKTVDNTGNGSVTVEDYGVVSDGEVISLSAVFSSSDYATLVNYWSTRTLVTVVLDDGTTINNARVVIKRTMYYDNLMSKYKKVYMEIWKC